MKRIFIRAGMTPLETPSVEEVMCKNMIGDNVGNLIYSYGVCRTLMVSEDTEFIPKRYGKAYTREVAWINENCDYFIIPLADMFRNDRINEMKALTKLVKSLRIPCVIAGVGLRAGLKADLSGSFPFDDAVKNFMNAVLEKSAIVGVRGEITGKYLSRLGYKEDKDYMVIGCPSMYSCGGQLKRKELKLTPESRISVNSSVMSTSNTLNFLNRILEMPNSYFLPQRINELWLLYTGTPYVHKQKKPMYPTHITDDIYQQDRVKYFLNAKSWMDFLSSVDLSIGGRMHGNIAAIQAGTPCVLIPHDCRMKELTDYHRIPHIMGNEIQEEWSLEELVGRIDFDSMYRQHNENFRRYIQFLDRNRIEHIYKNSETVEEAPLDRVLSRMELADSVPSSVNLSREELIARWKHIYDYQSERKEKDLQRVIAKYDYLNGSSIKRDTKYLAVKVLDKFKKRKRTNYERVTGKREGRLGQEE